MKTDYKAARSILIKFCILQAAYWCSFGAFTSFYVAFVKDKGMNATQIGTMLAFFTFFALVGQFFWGSLSDKFKTNKKTFILACSIMLLVYYFSFFLKDFNMIILAYGLLGFVQTPVPANLDTWILKTYHETPEMYGPIRSSGSFFYALFTFFYGGLLMQYGFKLMLIFSTIFVIICIVTAFLTPEQPIPSPKIENTKNSKAFFNLLLSGPFIFILIVLVCTGMANTPLNNMIALIISNVNGSISYQGYAMFIAATFQVPFMLLAPKLTRFSAKNRIFFSGLMNCVAILIISLAPSPILVVAGYCFSGISYGLLFPAMRQIVFETSPSVLQTSAQGTAEACFSSLAGMASSILAGILIDNFGIRFMLITLIFLQSFGLLMFIKPIYSFFNKKKCTSKNSKITKK